MKLRTFTLSHLRTFILLLCLTHLVHAASILDLLPPEINIVSQDLTEVKEGEICTAVISVRNPTLYPRLITLSAPKPPSQWTVTASYNDQDITQDFLGTGWSFGYLGDETITFTLSISPTVADPNLIKGDMLNLEITASLAHLPLGKVIRKTGEHTELLDYEWRLIGGKKKIDYYPPENNRLGSGGQGQTDMYVVNVTDGGDGKVKVHTKTVHSTGKDVLLAPSDSVLNELGLRCTLERIHNDTYILSITCESNTSNLETVNFDFIKGDVYSSSSFDTSNLSLNLKLIGIYQPDLTAAAQQEAFTGQGPYIEGDPDHHKSQTASLQSSLEYTIRLQNTGDFSDAYWLKMTPSQDLWIVRLFDAGSAGSEITEAVNSETGWFIPYQGDEAEPTLIAPTQSRDIRLVIVPSTTEMDNLTLTFQATSDTLKQQSLTKEDKYLFTIQKAEDIGLRIIKWDRKFKQIDPNKGGKK